MVLQHVCGCLDALMISQSAEHTIGLRHHFSLLGDNLYLWVKRRVEALDNIVEPVKHTHHTHHRQSSQSHPRHRNGRDVIDGVMTLLREEVTQGEAVGKVHDLLFQEFVDVFNIVERVVYEELQLGNDTQLVAHAVTEFEAHLLHVVVDVGNNFSTAF